MDKPVSTVTLNKEVDTYIWLAQQKRLPQWGKTLLESSSFDIAKFTYQVYDCAHGRSASSKGLPKCPWKKLTAFDSNRKAVVSFYSGETHDGKKSQKFDDHAQWDPGLFDFLSCHLYSLNTISFFV